MNKKEHITKILEDEFLTDGWCETSTGFESMGYVIEDVVEKIMDQTCKNCKWFREERKLCANDASIAYTSQEAIYCDDSCNKWQPK